MMVDDSGFCTILEDIEQRGHTFACTISCPNRMMCCSGPTDMLELEDKSGSEFIDRNSRLDNVHKINESHRSYKIYRSP